MAYKVMVVVHGMGEQARNQALLGLVRPMLELMRKRGDPGKLRDLDGDLEFNVPARVDLRYGDMSWRLTEYWWAEEFRPPPVINVSNWIGRRLIHHLRSLIVGMRYSFIDLMPADPRFRDPLAARIYKGGCWDRIHCCVRCAAYTHSIARHSPDSPVVHEVDSRNPVRSRSHTISPPEDRY